MQRTNTDIDTNTNINIEINQRTQKNTSNPNIIY